MSDHLDETYWLSFEWDEREQQLQIHGSRAGLERLARTIEKLLRHNPPEHVHLMTPEWGGDELTSEKQNNHADLINHVKLYYWDLETSS